MDIYILLTFLIIFLETYWVNKYNDNWRTYI